MKQYEEVFFALVRTALWKAPLEVPEGFRDWGSVMKLAKSQAMTGLVADVLLRSPQILSTLPERFVARLQEIPLENMGVHTVLNNTLIMVVTRLREHGIEPVLLKGQGLASYYPVPQLRQCGDIDLYVGVENYEKAYEVLEPVATEIDDRSKIWGWMHFHLKIGPVLIEIHHKVEYAFAPKYDRIFQKKSYDGLTRKLTQVDFCGTSVNTPDDNFNAFYVFYHLWRHYVASGVGLRQLCDLMNFLHSKFGQLDLDYLKNFISRMELMVPWQTIGCIYVDILGMPKEEFPFYNSRMRAKADKFLRIVLTEGNFGQKTDYVRKRKSSYLYEKWFSFKCHVKRLTEMFSIFPYQAFVRVFHMLYDGIRMIVKDITRKR